MFDGKWLSVFIRMIRMFYYILLVFRYRQHNKPPKLNVLSSQKVATNLVCAYSLVCCRRRRRRRLTAHILWSCWLSRPTEQQTDTYVGWASFRVATEKWSLCPVIERVWDYSAINKYSRPIRFGADSTCLNYLLLSWTSYHVIVRKQFQKRNLNIFEIIKLNFPRSIKTI